MIKLIVWLLLIAMALRGLVKLLRGVSEGLYGPPAPKAPKAVPLARDPICGTYVVPSKALSAGAGAQTKFFCSDNCRRAYAVRERNGASSAARASDVSLSEAPEGTAAKRGRRAPLDAQ